MPGRQALRGLCEQAGVASDEPLQQTKEEPYNNTRKTADKTERQCPE
jgi:hypothetical protein